MKNFSLVACCNSVRIHTLLFVIFQILCAFFIFLDLLFSLIKDYYYYYYYYYYMNLLVFVVAFYIVSFVCMFLRTPMLYLFAVTFIHGHFAL